MKSSKYILVHSADVLAAANKAVAEAVRPEGTSRSAPTPRPITIGLWDLGAWLGGLTRLIERMNRAQRAFVFFEVKATVPVGFISRPERIRSWLTEAYHQRLGRKLRRAEKQKIESDPIANNLIANDYFGLAEAVRKDLKIDYIIGITPSMVAGDDEDEIYWNHFSTFNQRTILVSTYQLREFAQKSGRSFEAFLAVVVVAQLLVARFYPKLGFHDNRGCLIDYNKDRVSLVDKVLNVKIESTCMKGIASVYRTAAQSMVQLLRKF